MGQGRYNNYPDASDDHGIEGSNILMCDGHVQWVKGGKNYVHLIRNRSGRKPLPISVLGQATPAREPNASPFADSILPSGSQGRHHMPSLLRCGGDRVALARLGVEVLAKAG